MQRICQQCLTVTFGVAAITLLCPSSSRLALGDEPDPANQPRESFSSPFTPEENRWLMDAADARRWQKLQPRVEPGPDVRPLRDDTMPEFLQSIQRGLGGPLIDRFDWLAPPAAELKPWWKQFDGSLDEPAAAPTSSATPSASAPPPGAWITWPAPAATNRVVLATAEATDRVPPPRPIVALRSTAVDLDAKANHLEELQLYEQADALRGIAQQLREDARRLAAGAADRSSVEESAPDATHTPATGPPLESSDPQLTRTGWAPPIGRYERRLRLTHAKRRPGGAVSHDRSPDGAVTAEWEDERSVLIEPPTE